MSEQLSQLEHIYECGEQIERQRILKIINAYVKKDCSEEDLQRLTNQGMSPDILKKLVALSCDLRQNSLIEDIVDEIVSTK